MATEVRSVSEFVRHETLWRAIALAAAAPTVRLEGGGPQFDYVDAIPERVWRELEDDRLVERGVDDEGRWAGLTARGRGALLALVTGADQDGVRSLRDWALEAVKRG